MMGTARTLLSLLVLVEAASAVAQVHRCTDAQGKVAFSDVACPTDAKTAERMLRTGAIIKRRDADLVHTLKPIDGANPTDESSTPGGVTPHTGKPAAKN